MTIADLILKAKVNLALARDPRVGVLDVGVDVAGGTVTLTGDVDTDEECGAAAEIARGVEGVTAVRNDVTCGVGRKEETVEMVVQELLHRLDEEWNALPDRSAISEADYLRWALWVCFKFRIPERLGGEDREKQEADALEQALTKIAGQVGAPKALIALEMLRQADEVSTAPPRPAEAAER
jgi:BON domain-containing protein